MKLSFSLPPRSKSRVRPISDIDEGNLKEFFTEFDPSKTLTKPRCVIPPIENRWRPHKVMKNIQSASSRLEFEAEIPSAGSDEVSYGLNLRQNVEDKPALKPEPVEHMLLKSMRRDLESLPDAPDLEDFESVPVEGFGAALLAGYGWKPGQGIGLNAKEDVPVVKYKKWADNEGFGFNPDKARVSGTKNAKGNDSGGITSGHASSFVVGKEGSTVSGKDIALKGKNVDSGSHEIENNNVEKYRKVSTRRHEARASNKKNDKGKASWLRSHIRVRVISKHVRGGRLHLKKAVVTNVLGPTTCDITMDETQELLQGINQELLETALPRRGGPVVVLSGRHKGVYGSLVEKDLDKETGVVCDAGSKEMLHVKLEQVAEYMGDPDDIGY